jgi:hypothetical protein
MWQPAYAGEAHRECGVMRVGELDATRLDKVEEVRARNELGALINGLHDSSKEISLGEEGLVQLSPRGADTELKCAVPKGLGIFEQHGAGEMTCETHSAAYELLHRHEGKGTLSRQACRRTDADASARPVALALVTIYHDPNASDYPHPRLLVNLMARPSKVDLLPLEVQVTTILAWLVDRARPFALALLDEFLESGDAVAGRAIGARTRVTLPPLPPGKSLYPDLSIDVAEHAMQLLVEVKVDATFHEHVLDDGKSLQPDTYVLAWTRAVELDGRDEAIMRRVGTLSRAPAAAPSPDTKLVHAATRRVADISWHSVRDLVESVLGANDFGEVAVVAQDFVDVLETRILSPPSVTVISDPVLTWAYGLLANVLPTVAGRVQGASLGNYVAPQLDYVGRYLKLDFGLEAPTELWIYISTAHGRYNGGRAEANLWLSERPDAPGTPELRRQLATGGFTEVTDFAGTALRRSIPVEQVKASGGPGREREVATEWIIRSLRQVGVRVLT